MLCPYCENELIPHDSFGRFFSHQDGKVIGEIYKCHNEECESGCFNFLFHAYSNREDDLKEGHPC